MAVRPHRRPQSPEPGDHRFHARLGRLRLFQLAGEFCLFQVRPGHGRLDDDAGCAHPARPKHAARPTRLRHGLAGRAGSDGPHDGATNRRVSHQLPQLGVDLFRQHSDRRARPVHDDELHSPPWNPPKNAAGFHRLRAGGNCLCRHRLRPVGHQPAGAASGLRHPGGDRRRRRRRHLLAAGERPIRRRFSTPPSSTTGCSSAASSAASSFGWASAHRPSCCR